MRGRLALLPLFVALVVYESVKNSGGVGSGGVGTNLDSPAENAEMHRGEGNLNVANVEVLPVANPNTQLETGNIGTGNTSTMATLDPPL